MATHTLTWDEENGILKCKVVGFLSEDEAKDLAADLIRMVPIARRKSGRMLVLFDNQQGTVFSARAAEALQVLKTTNRPGDRTAVLVSDNLHKLQATMLKSEAIELFGTEAEAVAWLLSPDQ